MDPVALLGQSNKVGEGRGSARRFRKGLALDFVISFHSHYFRQKQCHVIKTQSTLYSWHNIVLNAY